MNRAFLLKIGGSALLGFFGGAAVDIRKYRVAKKQDPTVKFDLWVALESWGLAAAAAGLAAAGLTGVVGE